MILYDFLRIKEFKNDDEFLEVLNAFSDKIRGNLTKIAHLRALLNNVNDRNKKITEYRIEFEEIRRQVLKEIKESERYV